MSVHSASSVYNPGQRILPTAGPRVLLGNVEFQEETAEGSSPSFISLRIFKGPAAAGEVHFSLLSVSRQIER